MDFAGRRILITGGAHGLGRTAAWMFHAAGARVAIHGWEPTQVSKIAGEKASERLFPLIGDLRTVAGCREVVDSAVAVLGGLDCLVHNVSFAPHGRLAKITEAIWDEVIDINLRSAMFCIQRALRPLRDSRGNVVMVSSIAALMGGPPELFAYSVAKAGLFGLTRTLALELAGDGVRVNCVCPGFIGDDPEADALTAGRSAAIDKVVPLGRAGTLSEVASPILYLASKDAGYCTGLILTSDGGCLANMSWGSHATHVGESRS